MSFPFNSFTLAAASPANMTTIGLFDLEKTPPPDNGGYGKEFWIGIMVSIVTNLIQSFAMAFQRKSHILNDAVFPVELRKPSWKRPMWVIGFGTFLTANIIGSVFSIGYLPIVILAPIGAMGMVFNAIAARVVLKDPFTKQSVLGTLLIVVGALLVGLFGVIPEPDHDIDDLIRLYKRPAFIAYFSVVETFIVTTLILSHVAQAIYHRLEKDNFQRKLFNGMIEPADFKILIGICFGIISGNISSQSMLFAKSGIELIILTVVFDMNQLQYALTWIILVMMVITAILQLYYLNLGLRLCDTVVLIPLSFCAFNVSCLFNGLVYYDQWNRLFWWQLLLVMVGVTITVSGVLVLSWRSGSWARLKQGQEETVIQSEYAALLDDENTTDDDEDDTGHLRISAANAHQDDNDDSLHIPPRLRGPYYGATRNNDDQDESIASTSSISERTIANAKGHTEKTRLISK
ncbi:hypothetical protein BC940DRAFT_287327 [Gongronella butleri]|nr:hypothetical protein BC940DRAFT_287327 [Gongronella butleri]